MSEETTLVADTTNTGDETKVSTEETMYDATKVADTGTKVEEKKEDAVDSEVKSEAKAEAGEKTEAKELELKAPEGSEISAEALEKIKSYAKEHNLTQEAAQKLVDLESEAVSAHAEELQEKFKKISEDWKAQAAQDKEYGGDNFAKNVELAHRAVERFSTPEFKQALNDSGFGNHPELLRIFVRIGHAMSEGNLVTSSSGGKVQKSAEEIFYGSTN